ncbi:DNA primase [Rheinheimera sp. F8]|uniref:DNA primase n=1 Tax=Rheinheimera sp. F8 TaxID=1763998 RepID=UPI000744A266|nr:DNA primase [Rheinheimera sp. F8]ALZ77387.1 DNA primase [Rheinheimera sp. F8]
MAGQIPRPFIDDLLARTDIVELIDQRVPLKKAGKNYAACCPFHSEKSPSFTVSADKQFYHCFGCGAHGNAISFMMAFEQLEFVEAIEELAKMHHLEVPREGGQKPYLQASADDYTQMEKAAKIYQQQLEQSEAAQAYVTKRGLAEETVRKYGIGYAPDSWDLLLKQLATTRQGRDQLFELKLTNRNDNGREYDFFRDRLMFPIRDKRGRVIGFGGRVLGDGTPKYLNSPETRLFHKGRELYGLYEARQQQERLAMLLVVEGYMDVVALSQFGIEFAVACLGTATTGDHMQTMFRYTPTVVCCYDGDRAGRDAAWRALQSALPYLKDGVELKFVFLPDGEDPDTLVRKEGKEAFVTRLQQALPLSNYLFEHLLADIDVSSDAGKSALWNRANEMILQIPSEFYRETLLDRLANLVGRPRTNQSQPKTIKTNPAVSTATKITPMRRAIALLLQHPALATVMPQAPELAQANLPGIEILLTLQQKLLQQPGLTTAQLLEHWRGAVEYNILSKLALWEHQVAEEQLTADFLDTFRALEDQYLQQRLEALQRKDQLTKLSLAERQEYAMLLKAFKTK